MFIFILSVCCIIYYTWIRYQKAWINAPKCIPFMECFKIFVLMKTDLWSKIMLITKVIQRQGGVLSTYIFDRGIRRMYFITDPEDSITALKACGEKDYVIDYFTPWVGSSSFAGSAQVSRANRKLYSKTLMPSNLDAFLKYFNVHSERFVQKLSSYHAKDPFDLTRLLRLYNLELLCDTMLAFKEKESVDLDQYLDALSKYLDIVENRFLKIYIQFDRVFNLTEQKKEHDAAIEILHYTSSEIIRQRRQKLKDIREKKCEQQDHWVLIDSLIEAADSGVMTESALKSEVDGVIFGGHDTSAYTMLYTLVLLGSYPEVQEHAFKEIQSILGGRTDVIKDDLARMVYIEAIIKESLRIYPYVTVLLRRLKEDVAIKHCTLAAGSSVGVVVWGVHRDECWGPDAEVFRPERWLEPDKLPKPTVLLGFGEGARNCIGRKYAMLSMKTLLVHLIRNYRFKADHTKMRFAYMGVLQPISGHQVAIEHRA